VYKHDDDDDDDEYDDAAADDEAHYFTISLHHAFACSVCDAQISNY
jgi:hypothetical protein